MRWARRRLNSGHDYNNLGALYISMQRWEEAEAIYSQAVQNRRANLGADNPDTISTQQQLGVDDESSRSRCRGGASAAQRRGCAEQSAGSGNTGVSATPSRQLATGATHSVAT